MAAKDFAPALHQHDGADITSGTVGASFIDASVARDAEILPNVLAGDGAGSGLDADLLDGIQSISFLRSDTSDSFETGALTIEPAAAFTVAGRINIGPNSGLDSRLQFGALAESLRWNSAATTFELTDDLQVRGALSVGTDDPNNDDAIYFDSGTDEAFFWDDGGGGRFQLTDDLIVQGALESTGSFEAGGSVSVGTGNASNDEPRLN